MVSFQVQLSPKLYSQVHIAFPLTQDDSSAGPNPEDVAPAKAAGKRSLGERSAVQRSGEEWSGASETRERQE